jgi:hypothetical protein
VLGWPPPARILLAVNERGLLAAARASTRARRVHAITDLPDPAGTSGDIGLVAIRRMSPLTVVSAADQAQQMAAYTAAGLSAFFDNAPLHRLRAAARQLGLDDILDLPLLEVFIAVSPAHRGLDGFTFEWAVHTAINAGKGFSARHLRELTAQVLEEDLGVPAHDLRSVLFGASQAADLGYTEAALEALGDQPRLRYGRGRPVELRRWLPVAAQVASGQLPVDVLPPAVTGLPAADLLVGSPEAGQWVAATVKSNPRDLEFGPGIRLAFTPQTTGSDEARAQWLSRQVIGGPVVCIEVPGDYGFLTPAYQALHLLRVILRDRELRSPPTRAELPDHNALALAQWLFRQQRRPLSWVLAQLQQWAGDELVVVDSLTDLGLPAQPDSRALVIADRGGLHLP